MRSLNTRLLFLLTMSSCGETEIETVYMYRDANQSSPREYIEQDSLTVEEPHNHSVDATLLSLEDSSSLPDASMMSDFSRICEPLERIVQCGCDNSGEIHMTYSCELKEWVSNPCVDPLEGQRRLNEQAVCEGRGEYPNGYVIQVCDKGRFIPVDCALPGCPADPLADIVFAIDRSGSMSDEINAVRQVVAGFAATLERDNRYRFAIVEIPLGNSALTGVKLDFASYGSLVESLADIFADAGGNEPSLDAIYELADPTNPLRLSFRSEAKKYIVLFTDEMAQSYRLPRLQTPQVVQQVQDNNITLYGFLLPQFIDQFQPIVTDREQGTSRYGVLMNLTNNANQLQVDLGRVFDYINDCVGGE